VGSQRAGLRREATALPLRRELWLLPVVLLAAALAVAGCGDDPDPRRPAANPAARSTAVLPDGTVPWIDERAKQAELALPDPHRHRPSPDEAGELAPCAAADLTGELDRWLRKLARDDFGKVIGDNGLLGFVRVRNTGSRACRLRGEVPARLLVAGTPLEIGTSHRVNDEARERAIAIGPGEAAELRLDWSSPYCGERRGGRQVLVLALPDDGGALRVPVRRPSLPRCFSLETQPGRSSVLVSGVFAYPRVGTPLDSPLNGLRARVLAPPAAAPVRAGAVLTYHVVLSNPTKAAISLRPCPAYYEQRFSLATPGRDDAVNDGQLRRMNCAPVRSIAAGGRRRFEMKVRVPPELKRGRRLSVAWSMRARGLAGGEGREGGFEVRIA
jgi:hypothetical protein